MELEQLRQLDAVAAHGTVSRAAEVLHLSQPALSRSLRRLEAELGTSLFDRTRNRLALNEAGQLALGYARDVLRDVERLQDAVRELDRKQRTLRVGTCAPAPLWRLVALVSEKLPDVVVTSETLSRKELERALMAGRIDLAILPSPLHVPGVTSLPFMHENLFLSVPNAHPLADRESANLAEVDGETFLLYAGIGFWRDLCREHLPASRFMEQDDHIVFSQQAATTPLLSFSSDAFGSQRITPGRTPVALRDAAAHVTFYLTSLDGNRQKLAAVLDAVPESLLQEGLPTL